ncbi:REP-associated tyrosine transposase [Azospirillum sp. sgz302134]
MRYRRDRTPGGTYFFTVVTQDRRPLFADPQFVDLLRGAFRAVRARHPFTIDAIVVLPDHLHTIWTLPEGDAGYDVRWNQLKGWLSKRCPESICDSTLSNRRARREKSIWQRRYWEHRIRDEQDLAAHMHYIHWNPVKHGLVASASEWPYSSFHACVRRGLYSPEWSPSSPPSVPGSEN